MTWPSVRLADVADVRSGDGAPQELSSFSESGTPFVRAGSLVPLLAGASEYSLELIPQTVSSSRRMKTFAPGTVVFAKSGMSCTKGLVYQLVGPAHVVNHLAAIECRPELDSRFLLRWFERFSPSRLIANPAYPSVKISAIRDEKVPLPPLDEQKRIAGILDAADALRAKRRESLAQLDTFLQSTFLDMFGDPVTNPMGWELESLGRICDVRDGTHDSPNYVQEGYPLLTSKNFKEGAIHYEGANLITDEDFDQINKRSKVDVGDLVMPMIGTIGGPVLVEQEPNFAIKNVALIKFSATSPSNRFVRALLCSHYFDHVTSKVNRGGTQKFVALKDLRGMPIPIPPLDLQHRFAAIVESIEQQKANQRTHLSELDTLFASLQSRAFRGDL